MNLLFDLDGTLTNSVLGISRCIEHALVQLGRDRPEQSALLRFVGPPLKTSFAELLATDDLDLIGQAVTLYRERYAVTGIFENEIYPDVADALAKLAADGHQLWVVTSKPGVYARQVVEHFDLSRWFRAVHGSELDGRYVDKVDLVRWVLEHERLEARDTWMIGDRAHDVHGGRANGTRTAGALWGYGSEDELREAGAELLLRSMAELPAALAPGPPSGPPPAPSPQQ